MRDDDPAGSGPDLALQACLDGCRAAGLAIVAATPWPERRGDKSDFNDLIRAPGGPEAIRLRVRHAVLETSC